MRITEQRTALYGSIHNQLVTHNRQPMIKSSPTETKLIYTQQQQQQALTKWHSAVDTQRSSDHHSVMDCVSVKMGILVVINMTPYVYLNIAVF